MTGYNPDISTTASRTIQFENCNEGRSYPFLENTDLTSLSGKKLPNDVLSDLHLILPSGTKAYLSSITITNSLISLCIRVFRSENPVGAVSFTSRMEDIQSYLPYRLEKLTGTEDIGGIVTFGLFDITSSVGTYRFNVRQVGFSDSVVSEYTPAGLRKIVDDRTGESVTGDVKINFSSYVEARREEDGISLHLTDGAATMLLPKCDRERPINTCGATPIKSINGISPDESKRIVLWFH